MIYLRRVVAGVYMYGGVRSSPPPQKSIYTKRGRKEKREREKKLFTFSGEPENNIPLDYLREAPRGRGRV